MMPAAFGPVLPATSRVTVMLVYAEETSSDFAREVPEGTRYVVGHNGRCVVSAAAHFDLKRGNAQNKHSLVTGSSCCKTVLAAHSTSTILQMMH